MSYVRQGLWQAATEPVWHIQDAVYTVLDSWWWTERPSETCRVIIIFLHGLGRLTCSGIDALPSFPRASTISSSSRFVVEGLFWKSGAVHSFKMVDAVLFAFGSHVLYSRDLQCFSYNFASYFARFRYISGVSLWLLISYSVVVAAYFTNSCLHLLLYTYVTFIQILFFVKFYASFFLLTFVLSKFYYTYPYTI